MRVLLLSPYPTSAPSNRTRVEQYIPFLEQQGVECTLQAVLSEAAYRGHGAARLAGVVSGSIHRLLTALKAKHYDAVLIHREGLPLPTTIVERLVRRTNGRLVFDFDDAIYLPQPHGRSVPARWLRALSTWKFGTMLRLADRVIAGNEHLAKRASQSSNDVVIIPTPIDTDRISPAPKRARNARLVIGWMGSPSTAPYLHDVAPALETFLAAHRNAELRLVGAPGDWKWRSNRVSTHPWRLQTEADDLRSFDVGLMPLPDNEWTRGKCGYKALQYMSAGVPTVSSPVGVATQMIRPGENGLLADSDEEWVAALTRLLEDAELRRTMGCSARQTVEEHYSVKVIAPRFLTALLGEG